MVESFDYEVLMGEVREEIKEKHGSVAKFLKSDAYVGEFGIGQKTKGNVRIYLANGVNGGKITKSFPILKRLYKCLFGITLEAQTIITRTQIITKKS